MKEVRDGVREGGEGGRDYTLTHLDPPTHLDLRIGLEFGLAFAYGLAYGLAYLNHEVHSIFNAPVPSLLDILDRR